MPHLPSIAHKLHRHIVLLIGLAFSHNTVLTAWVCHMAVQKHQFAICCLFTSVTDIIFKNWMWLSWYLFNYSNCLSYSIAPTLRLSFELEKLARLLMTYDSW